MSIFIDCGTNLKQGMIEILDLHSDIEEVYSFEGNTMVYDFIDKTDGIHYFNMAVSNKTGFTEFHIEKDPHTLNKDYFGLSSRIQSPEVRDSNFKFPFDVDGVTYNNLEEFIADTYKKIIVPKVRLVDFIEYLNVDGCDIILKLDVEGEEFAILEDMKQSDSFKNIKKLYVEFHENSRLPQYDTAETWVQYFKEIGLDFTQWK
jgi:FkbM family methyltransferase